MARSAGRCRRPASVSLTGRRYLSTRSPSPICLSARRRRSLSLRSSTPRTRATLLGSPSWYINTTVAISPSRMSKFTSSHPSRSDPPSSQSPGGYPHRRSRRAEIEVTRPQGWQGWLNLRQPLDADMSGPPASETEDRAGATTGRIGPALPNLLDKFTRRRGQSCPFTRWQHSPARHSSQ